MPLKVRRVVVENDSAGQSIVADDQVLQAATVRPSLPIAGCELWVTDAMPVDNTAGTQPEQQQGSLERFGNLYVRNGQGTAFRITEIPPGTPKVFHRTESVDYDVILSGEIDLVLDDDQTIHLRAGDTVVLRGALHAWWNRGTEPAVLAFIMIDAAPVVADGRTLDQHYPSQATP
ncbi:cupin domain-containing protein [Mycobacterium sp.]|uniref:cupin domain-containing protein n=1 Tax=Mycobacterium sp. TaxID=1785 RepID=UPI003D0B4839